MKLKSIKLWLTIAFTGLFTYLLISKNISEDIYSNLLTIIILSYFGANTAIKFNKNNLK